MDRIWGHALTPLVPRSLAATDAASWSNLAIESVREWTSGLFALMLVPIVVQRAIDVPSAMATDPIVLGELLIGLLAGGEWWLRWRRGRGSWRSSVIPLATLGLILLGLWMLGPFNFDYLTGAILLCFVFLPLRSAVWSAMIAITVGFLIADLRWMVDGDDLLRFLAVAAGIFGLSLMTLVAFMRVSVKLWETGNVLQGSLETMRQGLVVCSPSGEVSFHNIQATTLLGLSADEAATASAIAARLRLADETWLATDRRRRVVRTPEGRWLDLASHTLPSGEVVRSLSDVTDYEEARIAAESDASARSTFLGSMSHELRTPLNAMLGVSHLLLRSDLSPRQRTWLEQIQESGRHLQGLVNDALDLSRIELGRLTLALEPFSLDDIVQRVTVMLGEEAARKGLRTEVEVDPTLPPILVGDRLRLTQILINYVSNAVKYTAEGGVTVRLSRVPDPADRVTLRIEVTDTGVGLTEVQQATVFHPYVRFAQPRSNAESSGLGLAIVQSLAALMEGTVGVTSQRGVGSTFWCTVRLVAAEAGAVVAPVPPLAEAPRLLPGRAGARILVVDDNAVNREIAAELVRQMGLEVTALGDGPAALAALARERFDLLLLDLTMPGMDGYAVARAVRAMPAYAALPIIAVTANARAEDRERVLAAGMEAHLGKPFEPAELWALIDRWLPERRPLPEIRGLRYETGVALVAGNHALYRTLLRDVAREHRRDAETIREALEGNDHARAQRMVHTLKGVLGAIGATEAHRAAAALDEVLRQMADPAALAPLVEGLRQTMDPLLADLEAAFGEATPTRG